MTSPDARTSQRPPARLIEIVGEAVSRPAAEREAFVRAVCTDAAQLAEALSLLASIQRAGGFLQSPTVPTAAPAAAAVGERPGLTVDRYKLLEQIGEGGFGVVFLAEQREPVHRRVAFKVIKPGMDTRAVVARFEQERQALALMDHPNIARVFDAGATPAGRPYFVMELVKGEPITSYCDQNSLSIAERIELFTQVCGAVQHAHTKGVIHRDIKPANVLVSVHDGRPVAKVIDFGIAKAVERPLTEKTVYTEFRQLIGTPEYMSPEQAEGSLDIDTRTDVYSLGVLLYELLAGSPPFDPERLRSAAYAEIQRIIREVDPPRPSTRLTQSAGALATLAARRRTEPGRLGPILRGELDWIVMRALEKDRARRYESAGGMASDLRRYLEGRPVEAAPPGAAYLVRKFVARHRGPVGAAALVALALVAGVVGTGAGLVKARAAERVAAQQAELARGSARDAAEQAARADRQAEQARTSARAAEAVNALMTSMIERADRGRQEGRADITVREVLDAAAEELATRAGTHEPAVAMRLAQAVGETYRELTLLGPAERMLRLRAERQREISGPASPEYAAALNDLASVQKQGGDLDGAAATYADARRIAVDLGEPAAGILAQIDMNAAAMISAHGDSAGAEALLRSVIARYEAAGETATVEYAQALNNLASVVFDQGEFAEADRLLSRSVEVRRSTGAVKRDSVLALHNLASLRFAQRDVEGAERAVREELATARELYGDAHLDTAHACDSLAIVLGARGDLEGAERAQRESIAVYRALLRPDHVALGRAVRGLGSILLDRGDLQGAQRCFEECCPVLDGALGPGQFDSAYCRYELGGVMQRRGGSAQAEPMLRATIEAAAQGLPDGSQYEWVRHALASLLGSVIADQAGALPEPARSERFGEARALITGAAERLRQPGGRMGPKTRRAIVGSALEREVRLYESWVRVDPTPEREAKLGECRARVKEFQETP